MALHIITDIETCPTRDPERTAEIRAGIKPPATYKKPESIAAWMETEGSAAADEAVARTALDAASGEVIAIGLALDFGDPPEVLLRDPNAPDPWEAEGDLLRRFCDWVSRALKENAMTGPDGRVLYDESPLFVGHNVQGFDLPFLWRRMAVHGIAPQDWRMPSPMTMRHGRDCLDTMLLWAGPRDRVSLRTLARVFGLPDPKADGDGAQCWTWWQAGDLERVARYCAGDVATTREIWHCLHMVVA